MNDPLTRSERNVIAHVFAGFLFNPLDESYPQGVSAFLEQAKILPKGTSPLRSEEVTVAYEAQMRDLLYLRPSDSPLPSTDVTPSATAFDVVIQFRNVLTCLEVKFLTGWNPAQIEQELKDCGRIKKMRGYDQCSLVLLYPSWRTPQGIPPEVIKMEWQAIRQICHELRDKRLPAERIITWMESLRVPLTISDHGSQSPNTKGLFDLPRKH